MGMRLRVEILGELDIGCIFIAGVRKGEGRRGGNCRLFNDNFHCVTTINKSWGQTFTKKGLFLERQIFSYGTSHFWELEIRLSWKSRLRVVYPNVFSRTPRAQEWTCFSFFSVSSQCMCPFSGILRWLLLFTHFYDFMIREKIKNGRGGPNDSDGKEILGRKFYWKKIKVG